MSPYVQLSGVNLDQLYLPFLERLMTVVSACNARGAQYRATMGYRSFVEQAALYFQGRTLPGKVVTHARAGDSPHNYGLAVDFVRMQGAVPDWAPTDYTVLGEETRNAGLVWGGDFHSLVDCPHVQWPNFVTGEQLAPLKSIYLAHQEAPLTAVFDYLAGQPQEQLT